MKIKYLLFSLLLPLSLPLIPAATRSFGETKKGIANEHAHPAAPVAMLYLHGFMSTGKKLEAYYNNAGEFSEQIPVHAPTFAPASIRSAQFAQDTEIIADHYAQLAVNDNKTVIIKGYSNGAASTITFVGTYAPQNLKALVLESPYAHINNVVSHHARRFIKNSFLTKTVTNIGLTRITNHRPSHTQPIDMVHLIPHTIPVLFICSREDHIVPVDQTIQLYSALKSAGHPAVHLLILNKGRHGELRNGLEGPIYKACEHAFYKKYGLPFNEDLTQNETISLLENPAV